MTPGRPACPRRRSGRPCAARSRMPARRARRALRDRVGTRGRPEEFRLEYRHKDGLRRRGPDDLVLQCRDAGQSCPPVRFRHLYPPGRKRPAIPSADAVVQVEQAPFQSVPAFHPRRPVHACRRILLQLEAGCLERVLRDAVQKRSWLLLRFPRGCLPHPLRRLRHASPALCPVHALASRIPPGSGPSLHRLRRNGRSPVRRLRQYYGRIRPLQSVRRRFGPSPFFSGPGTTAGAN